MNASLPIDAPCEIRDRSGALLRVFRFLLGLVVRTHPVMGFVVVLTALPRVREVVPDFCLTVLWVSFFCQSMHGVSVTVQQFRWMLPLGHYREAVLLWWWRVPLTPLLAFLAGLGSALAKGGSESWRAAFKLGQGSLWVAGMLGALSLVQTLLPGTRPLNQAMRGLSLLGVALALGLATCFPPLVAGLNSGDYDLVLNAAAAVSIPASYGVLRFAPREEFLWDLLLTEQAASRELEARDSWRNILSAVDGSLCFGVGRRHWGVQLLGRCLLSTSAIFFLTLSLLLHYVLAFTARRTGTILGDTVAMMVAMAMCLLPVDPRVLRRQPLSAWSITAMAVVLSVCAAAFWLLPHFAFERIPGTWGVRFFFSNLISPETFGIVWTRAALLLLGWTGWIHLGSRAMPLGQSLGDWWPEYRALIGLWALEIPISFFRECWGWRSDLCLGSVILLGSAAFYYRAIRWGNWIYRTSPRGRV